MDQLINHDWKTNLDTTSDAAGSVEFRGFHGRYQIEVTTGGQMNKFNVTLGANGPVKATLRMP